MREYTAEHGIRFLDFTTTTPLESDDFMADLDHVSRAGNEMFKTWALANGLGFLLQPADGASLAVPVP